MHQIFGFLGLFTFILATSAAQAQDCSQAAGSAAKAVEMISQNSKSIRVSKVEKLGLLTEGYDRSLNDRSYEVTTKDIANDGYSRYTVTFFAGSCVIESLNMTSQD